MRTGGTVLINLEIFDNYMEQFRQPARPLKEPLYGQEENLTKSAGVDWKHLNAMIPEVEPWEE